MVGGPAIFLVIQISPKCDKLEFMKWEKKNPQNFEKNLNFFSPHLDSDFSLVAFFKK